MKLGGFHLTKWLSNSQTVLNDIPESERAEVKQLTHPRFPNSSGNPKQGVVIFHLFICLRRFIYGQHKADVDLRPVNNDTMSKDQTTTPETPRPTLFDKCVGSLTSPVSLLQ